MIAEILLVVVVLLLLFLIYKTVVQKPEVKPPPDIYAQLVGDAGQKYGQLMGEVGKLQKTMEERTKQQMDAQRQYQERVDKSLSSFVSVISGTKRRGAAGEAILKEVLAEPIKTALIVTNLDVAGKNVEFAWDVGYGRYIPIDSKLPEVDELYERYSKSEDIAEQKELKAEITKKIKKRIEDVKEYKNKQNTIDKCILALPDGLMEAVPELSAEVQKSGVAVCGYSHVFFYAHYLAEAYRRTLETGDVGEYQHVIGELMSLMREIADRTATIDRAITTIENANREIKAQTIQSERYKVGGKKEVATGTKQ